MNKILLFFMTFLLVACMPSNTATTSFMDDFSSFIKSTKNEFDNGENIDWTIKSDSLNHYKKRKESYKLSTDQEKYFTAKSAWLEERLSKDTSTKKEKVNFYFENSLSINGYLGQKNFDQTVNRIYRNIDESKCASFFVNTKEYPQKNIIEKINSKDINVGNIKNSDHTFIFENAIKNASDNNISIVITDGIYSVNNGNLNIVSIEIENAFKKALKVSEIESVVLKMSSKFVGDYYATTCESGKNKKQINQERPYYVMIFGNAKKINEILQDIVVTDDLSGYKEQARFSLTKNIETSYTILITGEEKHGAFEAQNKGSDIIHDIIKVKKIQPKGSKEKKHLQFGIAVDFNNTNLPESYLKDIQNYSINDELGYTIESVISIKDLKKSGNTYKKLQKINGTNKLKLSHVIIVKSEAKLYGKLEILLNNNLPKWIENTGDDDDCEIRNDTDKTFVFDELMNGISKAYSKINNKKEVLKININIKA